MFRLSLFLDFFFLRILAKTLICRLNATSKIFPLVLLNGREFCLSATAATFCNPTAECLARLCSTGRCGISRVLRMLLSISRADGRLMGGMCSLRIWIS